MNQRAEVGNYEVLESTTEHRIGKIRDRYGVPARLRRLVWHRRTGRPGIITGARGPFLWVRLVGDAHSQELHPVHEIQYHQPQRTRRVLRIDTYLDARAAWESTIRMELWPPSQNKYGGGMNPRPHHG